MTRCHDALPAHRHDAGMTKFTAQARVRRGPGDATVEMLETKAATSRETTGPGRFGKKSRVGAVLKSSGRSTSNSASSARMADRKRASANKSDTGRVAGSSVGWKLCSVKLCWLEDL